MLEPEIHTSSFALDLDHVMKNYVDRIQVRWIGTPGIMIGFGIALFFFSAGEEFWQGVASASVFIGCLVSFWVYDMRPKYKREMKKKKNQWQYLCPRQVHFSNSAVSQIYENGCSYTLPWDVVTKTEGDHKYLFIYRNDAAVYIKREALTAEEEARLLEFLRERKLLTKEVPAQNMQS